MERNRRAVPDDGMEVREKSDQRLARELLDFVNERFPQLRWLSDLCIHEEAAV